MNNLIGTTLNPVNQNLSCGGSSGGSICDRERLAFCAETLQAKELFQPWVLVLSELERT